MAEIFDRLFIRILLAFFVCLILYFYRYAHVIFYPIGKKQILKKFSPSENPADTLHLFSRIVGVSIIFSSLNFNETSGLILSLFHFFVWGGIASFLYLLSIFLIESILLYNFEYHDEVIKKKNMSYSVVSFCHAIMLAYLTRTLISESENSLIILLVLWLYMQVILGFSIKYYHFLSKMTFNKLMIQKNMAGAFSYGGFTIGAALVIAGCFDQEHYDLTVYCIQVLLKIVLALIIYPLFKRGLAKVFAIKLFSQPGEIKEEEVSSLGYGLYEGCLFFSASLLTTLIVNQIQFGTIYPFF